MDSQNPNNCCLGVAAEDGHCVPRLGDTKQALLHLLSPRTGTGLQCPQGWMPTRSPKDKRDPGTRSRLPPPALIIFPRETSNYKGIQDRPANRVEKLDDLKKKIFNYRGKGMEITPVNSCRERKKGCNIFHLIQEAPPRKKKKRGGEWDAEDFTCNHTGACKETLCTDPAPGLGVKP